MIMDAPVANPHGTKVYSAPAVRPVIRFVNRRRLPITALYATLFMPPIWAPAEYMATLAVHAAVATPNADHLTSTRPDGGATNVTAASFMPTPAPPQVYDVWAAGWTWVMPISAP